jgi:cytochrome c-type biogenesis protein CcmH/NrfG
MRCARQHGGGSRNFARSQPRQAHAALGQIAQNLEWDLTSAIRSYRRAVKFSPKDAPAHQWYAEALMLTAICPLQSGD